MAWLYLIVAGLFEIGLTTGIKYSEGFTWVLPSVITIGCVISSMWALALAVRSIPVGTAYAVWTGIGAIGAVLVGIFAFSEEVSPTRLIFVGMIVFGAVGLRITTT